MWIASQEMEKTVAELTAPGKGILAADESSGTIEKRFKVVNVRSTRGDAARLPRAVVFRRRGWRASSAASSCTRRR